MKNRKTFSKFLMLALAVGLLGAVSTAGVLAQEERTTSTQINNVAPAFTSHTVESWTQTYSGSATTDPRSESSGTYPTNEGSTITFTATADDTNNDDYYMIVCEVAGVTTGNTNAPSCDGAQVCVSASTADEAQATCTKDTTGVASETVNWYSYVCDANVAGLCSSASNTSQGGTNDEVGSGGTPTPAGSPFHVNHAGNFGTYVQIMDIADYPYTTRPDANGVTLTSLTSGTAVLSNYYSLLFWNNESVDCTAESASSLAALITGSTPGWTLSCDLDDSTQGAGANPLTGTLLAAAIADGTTTTIDSYVSATAAGTGNTVMTQGTARLTSVPPLEPGDTLGFVLGHLGMTETDTNPSQDTTTIYLCSGESDMGGITSAFDYYSNTCTGGALLCSTGAIDSTTTDGTCTDTTSIISVPTAHATYDYKVFAEDNHSLPNAGTTAQTLTVSDVAPVLSSYTTTDSVEGTISAGGSDVLTRAVTFTDNNGDNDPSLVDLVFFDATATTDACSADENNCYRFDNEDLSNAANCTVTDRSVAGTGKTATGTDNSLTASCDFTIWFNANASANWKVSATATDGTGDTNFADSTVDSIVTALSAIGVTQASIAYGTVGVGQDSSYQTTTMENLGNQINDVLLLGTDMTTGAPVHTIAAAQQKWHHTNADFDWSAGGGNALTTSNVCLDREMAVRAVHGTGTEDEAIAWKIRIPAAQESGSYTGTNTFSVTANTTCSDGPF